MFVGSSGFRPNREGEALSRRAKRTVKWSPGVRAKAKRKHSKYARRIGRSELELDR